MKIVIGLGNPGSRYERTRHNIGWMVLDAVAETLRAQFRPAKGEYYQAATAYAGQDVLLVKPTTFMNQSGLAAGQLVEQYGALPKRDMLVIVDELQFDLGRIQLKPSGSDSGHNGLASLIYSLQSEEFPRLRCGIGSDFGYGEMADYVLSPFPTQQHEQAESMIAAARDAALMWIAEGIERAMSVHNIRPRREPQDEPPAASGESSPVNNSQ